MTSHAHHFTARQETKNSRQKQRGISKRYREQTSHHLQESFAAVNVHLFYPLPSSSLSNIRPIVTMADHGDGCLTVQKIKVALELPHNNKISTVKRIYYVFIEIFKYALLVQTLKL